MNDDFHYKLKNAVSFNSMFRSIIKHNVSAGLFNRIKYDNFYYENTSNVLRNLFTFSEISNDEF